jgi:hypothetical protein
MVLKHVFVVVSESFGVLHRNQKLVVDSGVSHITTHTGQEARHDVEVREMVH